MPLNTNTLNLQDISIDSKLGLKDYSSLYKKGIRIKDILLNRNTTTDIKSGRTPSKFDEDYWNGEYDFLTMQDVDTFLFRVKENCESQITEYAIENEKKLFKAPTNSLIISNAMTIGLSFISEKEIYINQNVFHLAIDENKVNKVFLLWYFNLKLRPIFQKLFATKYLSKNELGRIKIPYINKAIQDKTVAKIEPIEKRIKELKSQIKQPQEIINKVFAREFGFDLEKFEELKKIRNFYIDLSIFANNKDIRQSVKFHREAGYFVISELKKITNKKIKDFISEPIVLGKGISPKDYDDDNGEYYYISMATIKNWYFETENARLVSLEYSKNNQNKTVQKNDILIARSGEGTIGKVALIDNGEIKGIFADFTMRIRLKNYNHLFAYYYFRTEYFQYLIEINKKGLGNNTNIFPSQIQEFYIPNISLTEQERIVNEIKTELDKQKEIEKEIENERNKIDKIIEEVIK